MYLSIIPSYLYKFMYLKINNRPAAACTYDVHACMHARVRGINARVHPLIIQCPSDCIDPW